MLDFLIPMALSVLFAVIKNPAKVAETKKALRKLRDNLNALNLDD